ncbi:hypothetical protein [Kaarinaea lacus]
MENCTAIVENKNGQLEVLRWANMHESENQPLPGVITATNKAA